MEKIIGFRFSRDEHILVDMEDMKITKTTDEATTEYIIGGDGGTGTGEADLRYFKQVMTTGETQQLVVTTSEGGSYKCTRTSAAVTSITDDGLITALGPGASRIRIHFYDSNGNEEFIVLLRVDVVDPEEEGLND